MMLKDHSTNAAFSLPYATSACLEMSTEDLDTLADRPAERTCHSLAAITMV